MSSFRNLFLATFLLAVSSIGGSAQKMRLDYKVEANTLPEVANTPRFI